MTNDAELAKMALKFLDEHLKEDVQWQTVRAEHVLAAATADLREFLDHNPTDLGSDDGRYFVTALLDCAEDFLSAREREIEDLRGLVEGNHLRRSYPLELSTVGTEHVQIVLTDDGVIIDIFDGQGEHIATIPRTASDIFEQYTDGLRMCDECGRVTDAGEFPDWVDGVCETCDPHVLDHPDNQERMR